MLKFSKKLPKYFPECLYHFIFPPAAYEILFLRICHHLVFPLFFILANRWVLITNWVLNCISLMTSDTEHLSFCHVSVYALGCYIRKIMSFAKRVSLISSFLIWMPFIWLRLLKSLNNT